MTFAGVPGSTYFLESTSDLDLGAALWEVIGQAFCDLDGFVRFELAEGTRELVQFFRARTLGESQ